MRKPGENPQPISHTADEIPVDLWHEWASPVWMSINQTNVLNGRQAKEDKDEKHISVLQLDLIERCIKLWSNPNDIVFDPFGGIGSTPYMALKLGRRALASELKESYYKQMIENCRNAQIIQETLF